MSNSHREPSNQMLPTTFQSIWPSCFRVEDFQKSTNQKQELPVATPFVIGSGRNEQSLQRTCNRCILPSFSSFGKAVSEKIFLNRPIRNKNCLWRPHVYKWIGPKCVNFIEDLHQMLPTKFQFIWQSGFREDFFKIDQSETRIACRKHVC